MATASTDGLAHLWDAATGAQLAVLEGHAAALNGVRFTPDGRSVLTWSDDMTARLWDIPADMLG